MILLHGQSPTSRKSTWLLFPSGLARVCSEAIVRCRENDKNALNDSLVHLCIRDLEVIEDLHMLGCRPTKAMLWDRLRRWSSRGGREEG